MQRFDKDAIRTLRTDIANALRHVADFHGIAIVVGGIRFTGETATIKVEAAAKGGGAKAPDPMAATFNQRAHLYGLQRSHLGAIFAAGGATYKVVGLKPQYRKYPIIAARQPDGKLFKFSGHSVLAGLIKSGAAA